MTQDPNDAILIIKLGALGDVIQALGPIRAIRAFHPSASLTVLTTPPFAELFRRCPFVDHVEIDTRPGIFDWRAWGQRRQFLRNGGFKRVYDLQNNDRSSFYFRLFFPDPPPEWVGVAPGASHRNLSPQRTAGNAFAGHVQTLALAGINDITPDPLEWMNDDISSFDLPDHFALIVPGSSPQRPEKRWTIAGFQALCAQLIETGIAPVLIGTKDEQAVLSAISEHHPEIINLGGRTSLFMLPALARRAQLAVGNDTGPMHLIAVTGCPALTLFDLRYSQPHRHQPLGARSHAIVCDDLQTLPLQAVVQKIEVMKTEEHVSKIA